jgi:hypothetical protein
MLESILAKLNPDQQSWIKRELSKDPYRREDMVSSLLGVKNTGFGHKWDGEGIFNSTCGKAFDYLEYKTSQAKKYNGLLKFHDYPESKTLDWIDDNVHALGNQVGMGIKSPTLSRSQWEDSAVCLEYFNGEFKNPKLYTKQLRQVIMNLHENNKA